MLFLHQGGAIGGAPASMLQLASALDQERYEPFAVFSQAGPIVKYAESLKVPAMVVPMSSGFFYSAHAQLSVRMVSNYVTHYRRTIRVARQLVTERRPALVHLNTSVLLAAAKGIRQAGTPIVWHVREASGGNPIVRGWMMRQIQLLADHIVVGSEYVARDYAGKKPITVIHNALDGAKFSPRPESEKLKVRKALGLSGDASVVGIIGSVQRAKGHFLLVESARKVIADQPNAKFLVVAGGVSSEYRDSVKGRIKVLMGKPMDNLDGMKKVVERYGLENHFLFAGYQEDIPRVISAMDVVVFPSIAPEGFGRPLIEGMAMGCPVVASGIGPTREITGDAALLVKPNDVDALASSICSVLQDRHRAESIGAKGRERFLERFEIQVMRKKIEAIYEQVLSSRVRKGA